MEHKARPWNVCDACMVVLFAFPVHADDHGTDDKPSKTSWSMFKEIHTSFTQCYAAALQGCIVCATVVGLSQYCLRYARCASQIWYEQGPMQLSILQTEINRRQRDVPLKWTEPLRSSDQESLQAQDQKALNELNKVLDDIEWFGAQYRHELFPYCEVCASRTVEDLLQCELCASGHFNLCRSCLRDGKTCLDSTHIMRKCVLRDANDVIKDCELQSYRQLSAKLRISPLLRLGENAPSTCCDMNITVRTPSMVNQYTLSILPYTDTDAAGLAARLEHSTGDCNTIALAKYWQHECDKRHKDCEDVSPWVPTRLLKLSGNSIRLIECSQEIPTGGYATVSHCWGRENFFVLSSRTSDTLKRGINVHDLPKSFSEVITFAGALGFRYIWIDSYCILQGNDVASHDDWQHESQLMDRVYAHGELNLAISDASSPYEGCFRERPLHACTYVIIDCHPLGKRSLGQYKVVFGRDGRVPEDYNLITAALSTRAWYIQESVLCRRMLHFSSRGIFWRCNSSNLVSETCAIRYLESPRPQDIRPGILRTGALLRPVHEVYEMWASILEQYCRCQLTRPVEDRLRAIQGIVNPVIGLLGDVYLWGHFYRSLPMSICWRTSGEAVHGGREVPSWSWAAVDTIYTWHDGDVYPSPFRRIQILAPVISMTSASDFTEHKLGITPLTLLGKLLLARVIKPAAQNSLVDGLSLIGNSSWSIFARLDSKSNLMNLVVSRGLIYVLPIYNEDVRSNSCVMLMLSRAEDGCYRRIGVSNQWIRDKGDPSWDSSHQVAWWTFYRQAKPSLVMLR